MAALSQQSLHRPAGTGSTVFTTSARVGGFTLIEVMVVLFALGIMGTALSLGIDAVTARDAKHFRERLQLALSTAADRAANRGEAIRLEQLPGAYRFTRRDAEGFWLPITDSPLFAERPLPAGWHWATPIRPVPTLNATSELVFGHRPPIYLLEFDADGHRQRLQGRLNGEAEWLAP